MYIAKCVHLVLSPHDSMERSTLKLNYSYPGYESIKSSTSLRNERSSFRESMVRMLSCSNHYDLLQ